MAERKRINRLAVFIVVICASFLASCEDHPMKNAGAPVPMYPDYTDIVIPPNIAPLNFQLQDSAQGIRLYADGKLVAESHRNSLFFKEKEWKAFLAANTGKTMKMTVEAQYNDFSLRFDPFTWTVSKDSIDPYLTYRLIEPDYEVFQNLEIRERCIENFDERDISTYHLTGNRCMNCHVYGGGDPQMSMMYVRGEGGGAILNQDGQLRKLDLKTPDMVSSSVYYCFSPDGRYIVFSTNVIVPAFHSKPDKRLEVYDSKSDVYVADIKNNTIIRSQLLADSSALETFPVFSPDGGFIYFCRSEMANRVEDLQYSLCRVSFDPATGEVGNEIETILDAKAVDETSADTVNGGSRPKRSVCHPKISPDGRHILYTVAYYGTFPIWHPEADLQMMDLETRRIYRLEEVNSQRSDTYHSWSSESRWFVFASKRDDGLYGRPYFAHADTLGNVTKPFVLPMKNPEYYNNTLKSFNVPELGRGRLPFNAADVKRALGQKAEKFR